MRSLHKLFVASLLVLGACFVKAGTGPAPVAHPVGPAPEPGPPPAPGMATISGTITDGQNHEPVVHAAVDISNTYNSARITTADTDRGGHFMSAGVPPGRYLITVRRNNYEPVRREAHLNPGNTEVNVEINPLH